MTERGISWLIQRVRDGDYATGRTLLSAVLHELQARGGCAEPEITKWFVDGVNAFLRGDVDSLDKALGLQHPGGNSRWRYQPRNYYLCVLVDLYRKQNPGIPLDNEAHNEHTVFSHVGRWYGELTRRKPVSASTVRDAWARRAQLGYTE